MGQVGKPSAADSSTTEMEYAEKEAKQKKMAEWDVSAYGQARIAEDLKRSEEAAAMNFLGVLTAESCCWMLLQPLA